MNEYSNELEELKKNKQAPEWMNLASYTTLSKGYRLKKETPRQMYFRVAQGAAISLGMPELTDLFFQMMWNNWLCPASPVLSNLGTDRGLPISCYGLDVGDSVKRITEGISELAMLSKNAGGVGVNFQRIRPRGAPIKNGANGESEGIIPFAKMYDSTILGISQGSTRRGAASINLNIEHKDWHEFIRMRRPEGDINRQCGNLHHCTVINDEFMHKVEAGDVESRKKWTELMRSRMETGESYIMYKDNVNRQNPEAYKSKGLEVDMTNICCLTGDTLVATKNGAEKIEDLVDQPTYIFDGSNWVINNTFSKRGETNELYEIEFKSGQRVRTTDNHRWFISNNYNEIRRNKLHEITSKDLQEGQFVEYHTEEFHGNIVESGAYLKGFLLGDGTYNKTAGVPKLALHSTKFLCEDKLISSCLEISGDDFMRSDTIKEPSFGEVKDYTNNGKSYGQQILKNMRGLSYRKKEFTYWVTEAKHSLPSYFTQWSKQTKLQFLSGLVDADGTYGKCIQITQSNQKLIEDIQLLVNSLGYNASVDISNEKYRLTIGSYDSYELFKQLDCQRVVCNVEKPNRRTTGYRQVKSIKKIKLDTPIPVYCPTVETSGKFALANGLMTGNSEITLYTDDDHSFICCLSSLNLARYDEWKEYASPQGWTLPYISILFLNGVLNEFISKARYIWGLDKVVRSAEKGRAVGLGVLGWHSFLQSKSMPFDGFGSMMLNAEIFKFIHTNSVKASQDLASKHGEPEWCRGTGMYNSHLIAVAPTRSNSIISGGVSAGIEPIIANAYVDKTAKGTFIKHNIHLKDLLASKGKDDEKTWKTIARDNGSVQQLSFLSEEEKKVFLTAYEIDQMALIRQAAQRQQFICQAQSLNLFFPVDVKPNYFNKVHIEAWKMGVKTLYYCRSKAGIQADVASRDDCASCEG